MYLISVRTNEPFLLNRHNDFELFNIARETHGLVLVPDLWDAPYDSLLRMEIPEYSCLVEYANDLAQLVAARTIDQP